LILLLDAALLGGITDAKNLLDGSKNCVIVEGFADRGEASESGRACGSLKTYSR